MFMRVKLFSLFFFFLLGQSLPKWMVLSLIYGGFSSFAAVTCDHDFAICRSTDGLLASPLLTYISDQVILPGMLPCALL